MIFIHKFTYDLEKEFGGKIPYKNKKANDFCYKCGNLLIFLHINFQVKKDTSKISVEKLKIILRKIFY